MSRTVEQLHTTQRTSEGGGFGERALIETRTPITYPLVMRCPGARIDEAIAREDNVYVYVFAGRLRVGERTVLAGQLASLAHDADRFALRNQESEPAQCLVLGGRPLHEPVARQGPFAMNTEHEAMPAFADYRAGRFGQTP